MIPISLQLRGFLSYKKQVDLSFEGFDLACISGDNGAGKSSLLDAITWVLFGKARRSDDGVINNTCDEAEVIYQFIYENAFYRVQRIKARNRSVVLEFQMKGDEDAWKTLTEHSVAETQNLINETLHLDYDTFINASFFLQGKADEFTQKNSTQRKEILAGILGMDVWDHYQDVTREARRSLENSMKVIEGSLREIDDELAQETQRKETLQQVKAELENFEKQRIEQQKIYDQACKVMNLLQEQRKTMDELREKQVKLKAREQQLGQQIADRLAEEQSLVQVLNATEQIEADFQTRTALKEKLQTLDGLSGRFYVLQQKQAAVERLIAMEESRLSQEQLSLEKEKVKVQQMGEGAQGLEKKKDKLSAELHQLQAEVERLTEIKTKLEKSAAQKSALQAENGTLREHMQKLKERMDRLQNGKGSTCPLCGQALSTEHRQQVIEEITAEGSQDAENYHKNEELLRQLLVEITTFEQQAATITNKTQQVRVVERDLGVLENELKRTAQEIAVWKKEGKQKLKTIEASLQEKSFAQDLRAQETSVQLEMEKLGYDAELHEAYRKQEQASREIEQNHQELIIAARQLEPLRREIETLRAQHQAGLQESESSAKSLQALESQYQENEHQAPNLKDIESHLQELIKSENQQRTIVGGAMQLLAVIETQKQRKQKIQADLTALSKEQMNFLLLEKAFGRDGVQALLMEEALPQMEMQANEILRKLSSGSMSVRFETEREYKDKKRDDKMQVLDILINDSEGVQRPYDLFSGGEAFRINFAIRLALSKVLAQRAGARLQMLVIDEGFGSQDAEGRQKLIEAINMIRPDFKKILVITHLEELKDAFPARIEVSKTRKGSQVEVIVQ
ncbi:MAG: AAA family ATPase [Anaerolineaceae bacterium]